MTPKLRLVPKANPQRDAERKHLEAMLHYLRLRIEIAQHQERTYERRLEELQIDHESDWRAAWGS